jgi:hypothetical protein
MFFQVSPQARTSKGVRVIYSMALLAGLCGLPTGVFAQAPSAPPAPSLDPAKELALIKQGSNMDTDPADAQAVWAVCTGCHTSAQFLGTPRSSGRWEQVFEIMSGFGAYPTDEQIDQIVRYFQRNLTIVNANISPAEELAPTLQVSDEVAANIALRRMQKKFTGIADLVTVPGVDPAKLTKLKDRLQF